LALSALNVKDGYIDRYADAHYGDEELYTKWMKGNELHCNQVLFTTEAPMGNIAQIPDAQKYILSQRTIAFVTDTARLSEDYLAILLKSPNVFGALLARSSGGTAKGVSQKSLSSIHVRLSNELAEQTQIGKYFRELDCLIGLHQRKHDKLVTLKKAMLGKMFPKACAATPEIRFKGFSMPWDLMEMEKLGHTYGGLFGKTKDNFGHGDARYVTYMGVFSHAVSPITDDYLFKRIRIRSRRHPRAVPARLGRRGSYQKPKRSSLTGELEANPV
jgi:type I restriction enzyme S subunit